MDRVRFLAVATAFAGLASFQACTVVNDADEEPNDGGAGMTNAGAKADAGSESPAVNGGQGGAEGGVSSGGTANGGAGSGGMTMGGAGASGVVDGGAGGPCDSDLDDPLPCVGVSEACTPYCNAARVNLVSSVSDAALRCLKADTTSNCDGGYRCLADATKAACGEKEYAARCAAAEEEAACGPPDAGDPPCAQLVAAFNNNGQPRLIECLESATCSSVYGCAKGFFFVE